VPLYVPDRPAQIELQATLTGRPVSHRHMRAWQDTISFLLGHNLPVVAAFDVPERFPGTTLPDDVFFAYRRSPGARALMVVVELFDASNNTATSRVTVSRESGATVYLPVDGAANGDLRGTRDLRPPIGLWADIAQFVDFIDVSALPVGALEWFRVRSDVGSGNTASSVNKIIALEVPRRLFAEDASDAGIDGGWPFAGNPIWDGSPSTLSGTVRALAQVDEARTKFRNYRQSAVAEDTFSSWDCGFSVGVWSPVLFNSTVQPGDRLRPRRLYEASTKNRVEFVCRYTTQSALDGALLRVVATGVGGGSSTTTIVSLPPSLGWSASTPVEVMLPCDSPTGEVRVTYDFQTYGTAYLRLSHTALIEAET